MRSSFQAWVMVAISLLPAVSGCSSNEDAAKDEPNVSSEQAAACAALASATCARKQACGPYNLVGLGTLEDCARREARSCETVFLLEGTTQTPARLNACAAAMPTAACGHLGNVVGIAECLPPPGTLDAGAACVQHYQCASGACGWDAATRCTKCLAVSSKTQPLGASCDLEAGLACSEGECRESICKLVVLPGSACDGTTPCEGLLPCLNNVCSTTLEAGATCTDDNECRYGFDCSQSVCTSNPPGAGPPAGSACGFGSKCGLGLYCAGPEGGPGTCKPKLLAGQSCKADVLLDDPCEQGLKCVAGTCKREPIVNCY
ncbi:MAG: hypothetical protein R3B13_22030 [Polyangiaceae bacterium]